MRTNFLLSGMFRSGTTMLSRMLHSNPAVACAMDPFAPIFKSFRNKVRNDLGGFKESNDAPLNDYYLNKAQSQIYKEIQLRDFEEAIIDGEVERLRKAVEQHCQPYSPDIISGLCDLAGASYAEIFLSGIDLIGKSYGSPKSQVVGFKDVWITEFTPHFLKLGTGNKAIHIIRDPRAVICSNLNSGLPYPLLFLVRQWRKSATLAYFYASQSSNIKVIRFEDLVTEPRKVAHELCDFLGVPFHTNMVTPSSYIDGAGNAWRQNTTYVASSLSSFNQDSVRMWDGKISDLAIKIIDLCCGREMALFRYGISETSKRSINDLDFLGYGEDVSKFSDWIKPFGDYNCVIELLAELQRHKLMDSDLGLSEQSKRLLTIEPGMFNVLSNLPATA